MKWTEANPYEETAEKALRKFFARHPEVYSIDPRDRDALTLLISDIVAAWHKNVATGPSLETQRIRWAEAEKHANRLRKALKALQDDLGDDFDDILAGTIAGEGHGCAAIAQIEHIESRAKRLVGNFAGKAADKRNDKFIVLETAKAWSGATGKRATANQECSPFFVFLTEVYEVYGLGDPPSKTTLQGWLPKQT